MTHAQAVETVVKKFESKLAKLVPHADPLMAADVARGLVTSLISQYVVALHKDAPKKVS